jgi:hypothetical protein
MIEHKELFFVGVLEPNQVRRQILGCSKDVISSLKRFEHFRELRREKAETAVKLRKLFEELNFLNNRLKQELPKTKLRMLKIPIEVEESAQKFVMPERKATRKDLTTLDKLESELFELEAKLDRLK